MAKDCAICCSYPDDGTNDSELSHTVIHFTVAMVETAVKGIF
eukprot:SAG31_NODE_38590_length_295_cov_0.770408_2_plen_41_part_01